MLDRSVLAVATVCAAMPICAAADTVRIGDVTYIGPSGAILDEDVTSDLDGGDVRVGSGSSSFASDGELEVNAETSGNGITALTNIDDLQVGAGSQQTTGTVRVVGDGTPGSAAIEVMDDFRLGANADSTLEIRDGGEAIYTSPATGRADQVIIGSFADFRPGTGDTSTVVDGSGSLFEINGRLDLGFNNNAGSDDMTISNGGRVVVKEPDDFADRVVAASDPNEATSGDVSLGGSFSGVRPQALDTLTVTGAGSELVYSSGLFTNSGNNRIIVSEGGAIRQEEKGDIASVLAAFDSRESGDFGFNLGSAVGESSLLVEGAGSIASSTRGFGIGGGDAFTGFEGEGFDNPIREPSSAGVTVRDGAVLATTGNVRVSQAEDVGTGFLNVGSGGRVEADEVIVNSGGVLSGDGGTVAADVLLAGGVLAPGASPGEMTIDGGLDIGGGLIELEVGAVLFDVLTVTGDLVASDPFAIEVSFLDSFDFGKTFSRTIFDVQGDATALGLANVTFAGLKGNAPPEVSFLDSGLTVSTGSGSTPPAPIPLPAGLPLVLSGIAGLGALRGFRNRTGRARN